MGKWADLEGVQEEDGECEEEEEKEGEGDEGKVGKIGFHWELEFSATKPTEEGESGEVRVEQKFNMETHREDSG